MKLSNEWRSVKNHPKKPPGLRISELADLAGVPIPTIKHYLNEGLLPRPIKTGRTMSYYDVECVEKVRMVKRLQAERFFPLSVIKNMMTNGAFEGELAVGEALLNIPAGLSEPRKVARKDMASHTGLALKKIDRMEALGLLRPTLAPAGKEYDAADCRIIALVRRREEAGMPFEYSLEMMGLYRKHIQRIVREDAKLFVRRLLPQSSAGDAARYIREGDRALDAFMPLMKAKLVRAHAEQMVERVSSAPQHLKEILRFRRISRIMRSGRFSRQTHSGKDDWKQTLLKAVLLRENFCSGRRLQGLGNAALALARVNFQQALSYLRKLENAKGLSPLVSALQGLAYYGSVAEKPGVFSPIQPILQAISKFNESRAKSGNEHLDYVSAYLRGAGLSIIPETFGTHDEAINSLRMVAESKLSSEDAYWNMFVEELKLKALLHLSLVHMDDEDYETACICLRLLKQRGGKMYYGKWASDELRELKA